MQHANRFIITIASLGLLASAAGAAVEYAVTDLGPIGGPTTATAPGSVALDLSDGGVAVGYSVVQDGERFLHATIWNGMFTPLPPLAGDDHSAAMAISSAGDLFGVSYTLGATQPTAVAWTAGIPAALGAFTPTAANSDGVVVGSRQAEPLSAVRRAVVWQGGSLTTLGTLGGENSHADDVAGDGRIVGWSSTSGGELHAFSWQAGVMHDLGTLGGAASQARAINSAGQVVGVANNGAGHAHAYLAQLNPDGSRQSMSDLGELEGGASYAFDINEAGVVVGTSGFRAFVWASGLMRDLNTLIDPASGWRLDRAVAINAEGQIIGSGALDGLPRAFLLTPMTMACAADLNSDGVVDTADLGMMIGVFGTMNASADLNDDGIVDTADLGLLISVFGSGGCN